MEDAQKAGVNPIYALGSPVMAPMADVGNPISTGISNMGQDLGRAADSMTTSSRRSADLANAVGALGLERAKLENDILRQQLLSSKMAVQRQAGGLPPAQPVRPSKELPGQGNNPLVDPQKQEVTAVDPARPSQEPGRIPDLGFANVGITLYS